MSPSPDGDSLSWERDRTERLEKRVQRSKHVATWPRRVLDTSRRVLDASRRLMDKTRRVLDATHLDGGAVDRHMDTNGERVTVLSQSSADFLFEGACTVAVGTWPRSASFEIG